MPEDTKSITSRFMNLSARIDACEEEHEIYGEFADLLADHRVSIYCRMDVCVNTMRMQAECGLNTPDWLQAKMDIVMEQVEAITKEFKSKVVGVRLATTMTRP